MPIVNVYCLDIVGWIQPVEHCAPAVAEGSLGDEPYEPYQQQTLEYYGCYTEAKSSNIEYINDYLDELLMCMDCQN